METKEERINIIKSVLKTIELTPKGRELLEEEIKRLEGEKAWKWK